MPRATTSGSARVAQRMRVLAHLAAFPDVPISQVARDLDVARSTVRNIQQQWGVEALLTVGEEDGQLDMGQGAFPSFSCSSSCSSSSSILLTVCIVTLCHHR